MNNCEVVPDDDNVSSIAVLDELIQPLFRHKIPINRALINIYKDDKGPYDNYEEFELIIILISLIEALTKKPAEIYGDLIILLHNYLLLCVKDVIDLEYYNPNPDYNTLEYLLYLMSNKDMTKLQPTPYYKQLYMFYNIGFYNIKLMNWRFDEPNEYEFLNEFVSYVDRDYDDDDAEFDSDSHDLLFMIFEQMKKYNGFLQNDDDHINIYIYASNIEFNEKFSKTQNVNFSKILKNYNNIIMNT